MKRVLVIAPHPYDETLGAGGTILKHIESGDEVHWLILTKPEQSKWTESEYSFKLAEVDKVAKQYGFYNVRRLNFQVDTLSDIPRAELIDVFKGNFELIKPNIVYLPFGGDFQDDYKVAFETAMIALKSFKLKMDKILCYEVISSFDFMIEAFKPNIFIDISKYIDKKLEIMNLYETEVQGYPMPRSVESVRSLSKVRGATIRTEYAESFILVREIY